MDEHKKLSDIISLVGHKILIKEDEFDSHSANGLAFIKKEELKTLGVVLLNNNHTQTYEVGFKVVYPKHSGVNVEIDGKKYKSLETREVFFLYNDEAIIAVNDYLVVKPIKKAETNGLLVVKSEEESNSNGIVVSLSGTSKLYNMNIGDEAVYSKYSGFGIKIKDQNYTVLSEEEIFFIIKPKQ